MAASHIGALVEPLADARRQRLDCFVRRILCPANANKSCSCKTDGVSAGDTITHTMWGPAPTQQRPRWSAAQILALPCDGIGGQISGTGSLRSARRTSIKICTSVNNQQNMPTPRKPTQQKINEGDAHRLGKHRLQTKLAAEPHAQEGLPPAPEHMPPRAHDCYEFWRAELQAMQMDCAPDAQALEAAAMAYHRATEAEKQVTREGILINDPILHQGKRAPGVTRQKRHPCVGIAARNWLLMKAFLVQFSLTPAASARFDDSSAARTKWENPLQPGIP